jgi:hypothetical protein
MEIKIKRLSSVQLAGNLPGTLNTYRVVEDGREFLLTRTSHAFGSSIGIAGRKGILYVDGEDNRVHHQVAAPSGACGLNTDDEILEGLSPLAHRAVLMADQCREMGEITIIIEKAKG